MPHPKNPSAYTDVAAIMETAAQRPTGVRYRLPTFSKAIHVRQRCYAYRAAVRHEQEQATAEVPGLTTTTHLDSLKLRIEDANRVPIHTSPKAMGIDTTPFYEVVIFHASALGELLDAEGNPIEPITLMAYDAEAVQQVDELNIDDIDLEEE